MMTIKRLLGIALLFSSLASLAAEPPRLGKLYWVGGNQLARANLDGSNFEVLVSDLALPDGLVVHLSEQTVVWTNMARGPDGSLQRTDLHGEPLAGDDKFLVAPGHFETGKEIELDTATGKLYWADRDGMKVMRANRDGSEVEVFVREFVDSDGETVALENPVGIALDLKNRHLYFTDRFMARVMRADLDVNPQDVRKDVVTLIKGDRETSRPIDIDLDVGNELMYWTDRGEHTVAVANFDGSDHRVIIDNEKVAIQDPIGITLELANNTFVWTDMTTHKIHRAKLDGTKIKTILEGEQLLNGVPYGPLGIVSVTLEPESGSPAGGDSITVIGENFAVGATRVFVGDNEATKVAVLDENTLRFVTPPGTTGPADLTVTTASGSVTAKNVYTYAASGKRLSQK